ncbi:Eisosome component PIL1-domain-containing protein [Collybia nuda]|uniref:Eisosome component PIL1-domain-containing protein n=1 Tax=Collybia nuda TaxID=64659 RepID=A0A9P5Y844_9AGAR|nr:Eisosome component PIL1-domain-containing protein [Collybia nuda]
MPVSSFLASIADKAQSAINASPLASHLPSGRSSSPDPSGQPPANDAAAQGGRGSHTFGAIQNQLRAFGQQYASTTPVQKIITSEKSVAIDFDSVARDAKSQSKELYTWGQNEPEDLRDVTDRLAYLNFVQGSLASSLAIKLDAARAPLKVLRDAETALAPRRNVRAGLHTQLARLEHDQQKGTERRLIELKDQIAKAESDDLAQEKEIELLKRKAIRESEQLKWDAVREYGEKLVLLSQAATPVIGALPTIPPSDVSPYKGAQVTGAARASLQRALDNYKTGHINLPPQLTAADLHRSDTRSFGESHASELSSISSDNAIVSGVTHPGLPTTPPTEHKPINQPSLSPAYTPSQSQSPPPINPSTLNQSPALIPAAPVGVHQSNTTPIVTDVAHAAPLTAPTVAETGVPLSAGAGGPGPASGSLHDIRGASSDAGPRSGGFSGNDSHVPAYGQQQSFGVADTGASAPGYITAEEEKKRLQDSYSQAAPTQPATHQPTAPRFESVEDEKKRAEREERERLLREGGHLDSLPSRKQDDDDLPPTYQDI